MSLDLLWFIRATQAAVHGQSIIAKELMTGASL